MLKRREADFARQEVEKWVFGPFACPCACSMHAQALCACLHPARPGSRCLSPAHPGSCAYTLRAQALCAQAPPCMHTSPCRFFTQQKAFDNAAGNPLKEDVARKQREAKERNKEGEMIDSLFQASVSVSASFLRQVGHPLQSSLSLSQGLSQHLPLLPRTTYHFLNVCAAVILRFVHSTCTRQNMCRESFFSAKVMSPHTCRNAGFNVCIYCMPCTGRPHEGAFLDTG